ncbi:MAG: hypothetical protein ABSF36_03720 [Candidatus Methanomethylicaceae archaeon]|jgi:hypothetical protein
MIAYSVHYKFSQHFNFPAQDAYRWCTDYQTDDIVLMGSKGKRQIQRINDDTLVLTDTLFGKERKTVKKRLVRLYPECLFWTNTRLSADGRHSQFLYQIVPDGEKGSRLDFTGSQVYYNSKKPTPVRIALMANELAKEDSLGWKSLAKAMEKDLSR